MKINSTNSPDASCTQNWYDEQSFVWSDGNFPAPVHAPAIPMVVGFEVVVVAGTAVVVVVVVVVVVAVVVVALPSTH